MFLYCGEAFTNNVVCQVKVKAAPNMFRQKPRVPGLIGHLPWVCYACLVGQSLKGKWWGWWWNEGGGHWEQCNKFLGICFMTEENPQKLRKLSGALSSVTSHWSKWSSFPPNEVCRITLPAPLAKPIGPSQKSLLKNLRSGIQRSQDLGSAPPGHS